MGENNNRFVYPTLAIGLLLPGRPRFFPDDTRALSSFDCKSSNKYRSSWGLNFDYAYSSSSAGSDDVVTGMNVKRDRVLRSSSLKNGL